VSFLSDEDRTSHSLKHNFPVSTIVEDEVVLDCSEDETPMQVDECNECVENEQVEAEMVAEVETEVEGEVDEEEQGRASDWSLVPSVEASEPLEENTLSEEESTEGWTKMDDGAPEDAIETEDPSLVEEVAVCESENEVQTEEPCLIEEVIVCEYEEVQAEEPPLAEEEVDVCESEDEVQCETPNTFQDEEVLVSAEETKHEARSDDGSSSGEESEWSLMSQGSPPSSPASTASAPQRTKNSAESYAPSSGEDFYRWFMSS
jgi:hypothetical protein